MDSVKDIFERCDNVDALPELNRQNYLFETDWLVQHLKPNAKVLQVGSADGRRIVRVLRQRPDLRWTGLEIDEELVELARINVAEGGVNADIIHGDITNPPGMAQNDVVVCLNHTLGYISDQEQALDEMRRLGESVVVSVFGETFDEQLAGQYFELLGLKNYSSVLRYARADVTQWGGRIHETPLGYLVKI